MKILKNPISFIFKDTEIFHNSPGRTTFSNLGGFKIFLFLLFNLIEGKKKIEKGNKKEIINVYG